MGDADEAGGSTKLTVVVMRDLLEMDATPPSSGAVLVHHVGFQSVEADSQNDALN